MSKESLQHLPAWFQGRPRWVQFAVAKLSSGAAVDDDLISALEEAAIREAEGVDGESLRILSAAEFEPSAGLTTLRLVSVSEPVGINALAPRKPLLFGTSNLAIVYGQNGSGKSGYTRLLKHLCGAPRKGILHPNVFGDTSSTRGCNVTFDLDGTVEGRAWAVGADAIDELRGVLIFDAHAADAYVTQECEVAFEPRILSLFGELVQACDAVSKRLEAEIRALPSSLPDLPARYANTRSGSWYEGTTEATAKQEIDSNCSWSPVDSAALQKAQDELHEPNAKTLAARATAQLAQVRDLLALAHRLRSVLEDSALDEIDRLRDEHDAKESAAALAASGGLPLAKLPGIGGGAWFALWNAAKQYSNRFAYPGTPFPMWNRAHSARCVIKNSTRRQPCGCRASTRLSKENSSKGCSKRRGHSKRP